MEYFHGLSNVGSKVLLKLTCRSETEELGKPLH